MKSMKSPFQTATLSLIALTISLPALADKYPAPSDTVVFCNGFTTDDLVAQKKRDAVKKVYPEHVYKDERNIKDSQKVFERGIGTAYTLKGRICKKRVEKQQLLQFVTELQANNINSQDGAFEAALNNVNEAEAHYEEEVAIMEAFLPEFADNKLDEAYSISDQKVERFKAEALQRGSAAEAADADSKFKPEVFKGWKDENLDEGMRKVVKKVREEKTISKNKLDQIKRMKAELQRARGGSAVAQR